MLNDWETFYRMAGVADRRSSEAEIDTLTAGIRIEVKPQYLGLVQRAYLERSARSFTYQELEVLAVISMT
jgi:chromosome segregation and condensation protein ScpB